MNVGHRLRVEKEERHKLLLVVGMFLGCGTYASQHFVAALISRGADVAHAAALVKDNEVVDSGFLFGCVVVRFHNQFGFKS